MPKWIQTKGGTCSGLEGSCPTKCDLCGRELKSVCYDARTKLGSWAWLCRECFKSYGVGLGVGQGQEYTDVEERRARFYKKA